MEWLIDHNSEAVGTNEGVLRLGCRTALDRNQSGCKVKETVTDDPPADPISKEDLAGPIGAIERMPTRGGEDNMSHDRLLAMIFLLRHTGLRIGDIVQFSTDRLRGNSAFVHMAKTGNPVWVPLPEFVVAKLKVLPLYEGKYYFADGSAKLGTATGNARRSLRKLSNLAKVRTVNPHRFRDTLAIKLLVQGVPIEDVKERHQWATKT